MTQECLQVEEHCKLLMFYQENLGGGECFKIKPDLSLNNFSWEKGLSAVPAEKLYNHSFV